MKDNILFGLRATLLGFLIIIAGGFVFPGFVGSLENKTIYLKAPEVFWDNKTCPLILGALYCDGDHEGQVNQIIKTLIETNAKNIVITWNGDGGLSSMANDIIWAIQRAQKQGKHVTFRITDRAQSAHAFTACFADEVELSPGAYMYFHAVRLLGPNGSKDYNVVGPAKDNEWWYTKVCKKKGLLLEEHRNLISNDHKGVYTTKDKEGKVHYEVSEDN